MYAKETVKPITYLKNNAAVCIRDAAESGYTLVVTQNGEAKAVVMGIDQYEDWKRSLAMLKLISLGEADIAAGNLVTTEDAFAAAEETIKQARKND
jgi:prevent-host-death family protein